MVVILDTMYQLVPACSQRYPLAALLVLKNTAAGNQLTRVQLSPYRMTPIVVLIHKLLIGPR